MNMTSGRPALRYGGRRGVRDDRAAVHRHDRQAVDGPGQRHALVEGMERDGVGADVARVRAAEREEVALAVERELGARREVAPAVVGHERLSALRRPLHRAADPPRGPGDQRELGIAAVARAEIAPDVARRHPHGALRHAERAGHGGLRPAEAAGTGVHGVAAGRGIPDPDRGARLHRHTGDPVHPRVQPHHVRGARERALDPRGVAEIGVDAHVRRSRIVETRRLGPRRGRAAGHRGQRGPRHVDPLGPVAGRRRSLGDDHRDDLADEPHAVGRDRRVRGDEGHVAARQHVLVGIAGHRTVREWLHAVGGRVRARQHGDDAGGREGATCLDPIDLGVGVRRAHEARVRLARHVDVVAVAASADEQARVLFPQDRFAEAFPCCVSSRLEK